MDSRMIDVAIGLALVFALASLAVTTLHEIWSSLARSRGRNLQSAIRSFLGETEPGFSERVLAHPLLQSLTDNPKLMAGRPSYIGADAFITALTSQLNVMYCGGTRPATPSAWVAAIRLNQGKLSGPQPQAAFVDGLDALLDGVDTDWDAYLKRLCAWYDAVAERSGGWFKRSTQGRLFLIGGLLALVVNINPFVIAPRLWNDEALRKATVETAIAVDTAASGARAAGASDRDLLRQVLAALPSASAGAQAAAVPTRALQADVDARLAGLERAVIAAMTAHRTQLAPLDKLEAALDPLSEIQLQLRLQRAAAVDRHGVEVGHAQRVIDERLLALKEALAGLALRNNGQAGLESLRMALVDAQRRESAQLTPPEPTRSQRYHCPPIGDAQAQRQCELLAGLSIGAGYLGLPIGWSLGNLPACAGGPCLPAMSDPAATAPAAAAAGPMQALDVDKLPLMQACLRDWNCALMSLLGWSLTGLATMLGAPFWFDALGKLVKLRAAGGRPQDGSTGPGATGGLPGGSGTPGLMATTPASVSDPQTIVSGAGSTMRDVQTTAEAQLSPERVRELQRALRMAPDKTSGFFDGATRIAILQWQALETEPETGELTQAQIERLLMPASGAAAAAALAEHEDHVDGCDVEVTTAEPDENLPLSTGGVSA